MFFSSRIRLKPLAQLCHRLATATKAGIEDRKIWHDESMRGSGAQRTNIGMIADGISRGDSITYSLRETSNFFPPLFRQMVEVGETSGQLDRTYKRLARHYDQTLTARREFISQLSWPMIQFGMALGVVGILIWIMGILPNDNRAQGEKMDMLGLGLIGTPGLIKYVNFLVFFGILILFLIEAVRRGAGWTRRLQRTVMHLPGIGAALQTLALARFTWAMQMVLDTSMDLRKALPLALHATGNDYYARFGPEVALRIEQGQDIHLALSSTGVFPIELLDSIAVGEESGRLAETMQHQAAEYQERAGSAISILAQIAGYIIWLLVAGMIVLLIFRLFSFYTGILQDAAKPL